MHYARYYDGADVADTTIEDDQGVIRLEMFHQMLMMEENEGEVPSFVKGLNDDSIN